MKTNQPLASLLPIYILIFLGIIMAAVVCDRTVETMAKENIRYTIIIDPGHGGEDGGATSCTGILESKFNLDIALRLNDFMHLLGMKTTMIRDTDRSVYTQGETIAQKKVSDLRERVRTINETERAVVVSIHQNTFPDGKYWGSQVFYPNTDGSKELAVLLQKTLKDSISPENNRSAKPTKGIYLMEHIRCTGVLVECGFLSNPKEEALLQSEDYQKKMCAVIASVCCQYLNQKQDDLIL